MKRIAITVAAIAAVHVGPARANDLQDAVLHSTLDCVHNYVFSAMPTGSVSITAISDNATAAC
jgi:hypothetical protein